MYLVSCTEGKHTWKVVVGETHWFGTMVGYLLLCRCSINGSVVGSDLCSVAGVAGFDVADSEVFRQIVCVTSRPLESKAQTETACAEYSALRFVC